MWLAHSSVPKINFPHEETLPTEEGGLFFCSISSAFERILSQYPSGKLLLLCDEHGYECATPFARNHRVLTLVCRGRELLPAFTMPESTFIYAVGGEDVLHVARMLAQSRKTACAVTPTDGSLFGCAEPTASLSVNVEKITFPLADACVFCDDTLLQGVENAYVWLLLDRLASFERYALRLLTGECEGGETPPFFIPTDKKEMLTRRFLQLKEGRGSEGKILARLLKSPMTAYLQLLALYSAFFEQGVPRRYVVPDYRKRCERAGLGKSGYLQQNIPTPSEYARRALALQRTRGLLLTELKPYLCEREREMREYLQLGGKIEARESCEKVKILPEYAPDGLCAIIRDFGLLED